jgi:hypothetical protein
MRRATDAAAASGARDVASTATEPRVSAAAPSPVATSLVPWARCRRSLSAAQRDWRTNGLGVRQLAVAEAALGALLDAGLDPAEAADSIGLLVSYVTGFALDEAAEPELPVDREDVFDYGEFLAALPPDRYPTLVRLADQISRPVRDRQFAYGMAFLLDGVERRGSHR